MINFENTYSNLPFEFYSPSKAKFFLNPSLIQYNEELSNELFDLELKNSDILEIFSGQKKNSSFANISFAYSGHQFGHFNPTLGDGRAMLLGEVLTKDNNRYDIQLKGMGRTNYSRNGDGLSALGPVLREYLISEYMHRVNIPTTRALCAIATGEDVQRETSLKGGVFTRVAKSHIRIGTFEYFAARHDFKNLEILTEYSISRHYPALLSLKDKQQRYLAFLHEVARKQSNMIAKWYAAGFIHGVMNTDNMTISGETIDYGPCAFMDQFKFDECFSFIDRNKRYAYNNQKNIGIWNLFRLASALMPLISTDLNQAQKILENSLSQIEAVYDESFLIEFSKKFGIENLDTNVKDLIDSFLNYLEKNKLDFTQSFNLLINSPESLIKTNDFDKFHQLYKEYSPNIELANSVNPKVIPRNHLVEKMIDKAYEGDYKDFYLMDKYLKCPFNPSDEAISYLKVPKESQRIKNTFCGT